MVKAVKNAEVADEDIISKIYFIRNKKIMLDKDLAELYGVTTGNLIKRYKKIQTAFPKILCFNLRRQSSKT
jgi:hypothetical protein